MLKIRITFAMFLEVVKNFIKQYVIKLYKR